MVFLQSVNCKRGVRLRLLVDKFVYERIKMELQITSSESDLIVIQLLDRQQQNKILTAIVDKEPCLIVEIRDNKAHDDYYISVDVLGFATYYLSRFMPSTIPIEGSNCINNARNLSSR